MGRELSRPIMEQSVSPGLRKDRFPKRGILSELAIVVASSSEADVRTNTALLLQVGTKAH